MGFASMAPIARDWPSMGAASLSRRLGFSGFWHDEIFDKFDSSHCFLSTYRAGPVRRPGRLLLIHDESRAGDATAKAAKRNSIAWRRFAWTWRHFPIVPNAQHTHDAGSEARCARRLIQLDDKPFQGIVEIQFG
jgi:hypothetical protein